DNKSTFHCCPGRNKVKPKSEKQEKKENTFLQVCDSTSNQKADDEDTEKPKKPIK
ncbi:hypothetical protein Bpfe_011937, partial [Biomphalaria pfeifferi]